jgi:hypothetical protein
MTLHVRASLLDDGRSVRRFRHENRHQTRRHALATYTQREGLLPLGDPAVLLDRVTSNHEVLD